MRSFEIIFFVFVRPHSIFGGQSHSYILHDFNDYVDREGSNWKESIFLKISPREQAETSI
ncbi:hypothetical protein GCM10007096_13310 [Pullulanibacillus pueri]|uniref:Uncharacterized protein n=1 Tax=Pullulanibacillus pueri TaxID=1437324 RepID=A0A8J2ZUK2_9BACL|nr:hypothetical protein GCM10007096_13310 [Pullulanibacillus pueri]